MYAAITIMNDDTLERIHNFVSQLIEQCRSHLPGVQLIEVRYAQLVSIIIVLKCCFNTFWPFDILEDRQKLLFFFLFLHIYLVPITLLLCAVCLLTEADRLTEQILRV